MSEQNTQRHRLQISLKSLLVLMLIVAAYFAGLATMLRRAEHAEKLLRDHLDAARRTDIELQVAAAKAEVAMLRDKLATTERMFKRGYVSSLQVQSAKMQLQKGKPNWPRSTNGSTPSNNELRPTRLHPPRRRTRE